MYGPQRTASGVHVNCAGEQPLADSPLVKRQLRDTCVTCSLSAAIIAHHAHTHLTCEYLHVCLHVLGLSTRMEAPWMGIECMFLYIAP